MPQPYIVGGAGRMEPIDPQELDWDPRGILWIWEPPKPSEEYVMAVDPTRGIVNWDRRLRVEGDTSTDNGCIQVLRKGRGGAPDAQVAEYAAPLHPEDLGDVANVVGRIFGGSNDDGQALAIVEVWPGPGEPTQRRMIEHGYTNLYVPIKYADSLVIEHTRNAVGWASSQRSRRDLWIKGTKHIIQRKIKLRSEWLIEEMADCQADDWMATETARARWGKHDDRVVAILLAIYAAHQFSEDVETRKTDVSTGEQRSWQASDMSYEALMEAWEERFDQIANS